MKKKQLNFFCDKLTIVLEKLKNRYNWEIIFVLDESTDNTFKILKTICNKNKNIKLIHLSSRFGHQISLLAGIDFSYGDVLIMMDTDLQHPPSYHLKNA